jgi:hypothetical protein
VIATALLSPYFRVQEVKDTRNWKDVKVNELDELI